MKMTLEVVVQLVQPRETCHTHVCTLWSYAVFQTYFSIGHMTRLLHIL